MCFYLLHLLLHYRGKFGQYKNLSQVKFINGNMKQFNELVFSNNLCTVSHLSLVNEDTVYVVYKNLQSAQPQRKHFVAAFTTAQALLHLYKAIEKLNECVLYMDTDSMVFTQQPGQWKLQLGNFLGEWTNKVSTCSKIIDFTTCSPYLIQPLLVFLQALYVNDCSSTLIKFMRMVSLPDV